MNLPWWIDCWEELHFDAQERLGLVFGDLPTYTALKWARSIVRIETSHTGAKVAEVSYKEFKRKQEQNEGAANDAAARVAVMNLGGKVMRQNAEMTPYWQELMEDCDE